MPHPASMFFFLAVVIVFCSWIFNIYGLSVIHPHTGAEIHVQSLLSPEGIRWSIRNVVTNFTGFAPLGMVMVAMLGIGVAEDSGFLSAAIRTGMKGRQKHSSVILWIILLGTLSNVIGDAGYIILIPIAAILFQYAGMSPVAGIITAYVSVACGYSANVALSTLDPIIARTTQEASLMADTYEGNIGPLSNYYFMLASTFLITGVIYYITRRYLVKETGSYTGRETALVTKPLSQKERRALHFSLLIGVVFLTLVAIATFSPWGILRGITGGMTRSPFIMGILFLISFGAGMMGTIYGLSSGKYRSDRDIVNGLAKPMRQLGVYFVIAFFAAQMFAFLDYSNLDTCLIIYTSRLVASTTLPPVIALLGFILFSALVNLIMVSATGKWSIMAFIFIPMFAGEGFTPDVLQCAFRIGDSVTNAITPFLFYMPLVLAYMQQYWKKSNYATLVRYTWRYTLWISVTWILFFLGWYYVGIPLGM